MTAGRAEGRLWLALVVAVGFMVTAGIALAFVSLGFSPFYILAGVCVPLVAVLSARRPEFCLALTGSVYLLATAPQPLADAGNVATRVAMLAILLAVLVWRLWLRPRESRGYVYIAPPFLALALAGVCSALWSVTPLATLGRALAFVMIFVVVSGFWADGFGSIDLLRFLRWTAYFATIANAIALAAFPATMDGRHAGIYANPNHLGIQCALLLPPVLALAVRPGPLLQRAWNASIAFAIGLEGVFSGSRAGAAALLFGLLWVAWPRRLRDLGPVRLAAIGAPIVAGAIVFSTDTFSRLLDADNATRQALWQLFPRIYLQAPLFGHGLGSTSTVLAPLLSISGSNEIAGAEIHNSYLSIGIDLGLLGLLLLTLGLVQLVRSYRSAPIELVAVVGAGIVSGIFESWFFGFGEGFAWFFWLAILEVCRCGRMSSGSRGRVKGTARTAPTPARAATVLRRAPR